MEKVTLLDKTFRRYIPQEEIEKGIDRVAAALEKDNAGKDDIPILLCVLTGSIMFTSEVMKRVHFPCQIVTIKLNSYNGGTASSGRVVFTSGLSADVAGRRVYIMEDIVDTGNTLLALKQFLREQGASEAKICTMLFKEEAYKNDEPVDFVGRKIENQFIVGYGLDYGEIGRNLTDIYILDK